MTTQQVVAVLRIGMDDVWRTAEQLGRVHLEDRGWSGSGRDYRAEIVFTTEGGSRVFAAGRSPDAVTALEDAIAQARTLAAAR